MFSGIGNQNGMFSQGYFSNFSSRYASSVSTTTAAAAQTDSTSTGTEDEQVSAREEFASVLKEKGMSEESIANLPESFWKKAEKKAGRSDDFDFADDKQLQKLADFLARKAETLQSYQTDGTAADSATISQEAQEAAQAANTEEAEETAAEETEEESGVVSVDTEEENAASQNPLEAFRDKLNQILLDGLGLGDLSDMAGNSSYMSYSASFEISYHSMVAVAGENGMVMQETSFSLSGSFDFMSMGQMGENFNPFSGLDDIFGLGGSGSTAQTEDGEEVDSNNPLAALSDYFSPEKTANRILDFSLGFFGNSSQYKEGGDTEESRQDFADIIGAAIQKGFDQALGTLGKLPDKTASEVDETHSRVFDGLDNFVKTGSKDDDEEKYTGIQAYSSVFEMNYSSTTSYFSAEETGAALESLYDKYFNNYGQSAANELEEQTAQEQQTTVNPLDVTA